ncbi:MAG: hypothetical protein ABS81_07415 [Pseudonocardia sp. SCN 72-86]|nr:MAG: hypothetical protein ABS81_07415 [Pseudonocardia sp. SCN 72-86]
MTTARRADVVVGANVKPFMRETDRVVTRLGLIRALAEDPVRLRAATDEASFRAAEQRIRRLGGTQTVHIRAAGGGAGGAAAIIAAVTALGPAAIAAGAVATAGIGAAGAALLALVPAAGVAVAAFRGVGDAVEALNKARLEPTKANIAKAEEALRGLTKEAQSFARMLSREISPELSNLQKMAARGLLPGAEKGLRELKRDLPAVQAFTDRAARAFGDMAVELGEALGARKGQEFVYWLESRVEPVVKSTTRALFDLGRGGFEALRAFDGQFGDGFLSGMEDGAARFAQWGRELSDTNGFREFAEFVHQIGPQVGATLGGIGTALKDVTVAASPLGGPTLTILRQLSEVISALATSSVGTPLLGLVAALGAVKLFSMAATPAVAALAGAATTAGVRAGKLTTALGGSANAAERATNAGSKVAGALGKVGNSLPIIGAGLIGISLGYEELRDKSDEFAEAVATGGMTMQEAINAERNSIEKRNFWLGDTTDKLSNEAEARQNVRQRIREYIDTLTGEARARAEAQVALEEYNFAVEQYGFHSAEARAAAARFSTASEEVKIQQIMAAEGVDRVTAALIRQRDIMLESANADIAAERAKLRFEQAQKRAAEATRDHGAASLEARDADLSLREAALASAEAAGEKAAADAKASGASETGTVKAAAQRAEYMRLAEKSKDPLRAELIKLADQTKTLPDGDFTVTAQGKVGEVERRSGGGRFATGGILPGWSPGRDVHRFVGPAGTLDLSGGEAVMRPEWTRAVGRDYVSAANRAARTGGAAGVAEFLARTAPRPGHGEGRRGDGAAYRNGGVMRFARGGIVQTGARYPGQGETNWTNTANAVRDVLGPIAKQMLQEAGAWGGGTGAAAALDWARTQVGKPYIWAASGPTGYDCSGAVSALLNVAQGRPIYQRRGGTGSMPWPGMQPGFGPGINIGWFTGNPGHTAATINGVNVESAGGVGFRVGGPVGADWGRFTNHGHVVADRGAMLSNGDKAINLSGRAERVLDPRQTIAFERLVNVLDRPRPVSVAAAHDCKGGNTYQLTVQNAGNSRVDLEAQFKRLEAMAGV